MRFVKSLAVAAAVAVPMLSAAPGFAAEEDAIVQFRINNMKVVGGAMSNIVAQLKGEAPVKDQIAAYAALLSQASAISAPAFKDKAMGLEVKTTAKEDIWANWDKFEGGLKAMETETAKLAQVAEAGNMGAIGAQVQEVGKTCKTCHDNFRQKD
ncbi:MAG: cytochrome c [Rhodospirillaceae bacterium]